MAKKLTEAILILRSIDSKYVMALYELAQNQKILNPILEVLSSIKQMDVKKILDKAGGVSSMDSLIDNGVEQSFRRGRISLAVLFRALVINAEKEMERREHAKK